MSKLASLVLALATFVCSFAVAQEEGPDPNGRVAQERAEREAFIAYAEDYRKKRIKILTEELRDNRIAKSDYTAKKAELQEISAPSGVAWPPLPAEPKEGDRGSLSSEHRYRIVDVKDATTLVIEASPKNPPPEPAARPAKGKEVPKAPQKLRITIKFLPTEGMRAGEDFEPKGLFSVIHAPRKSTGDWTLNKVDDESFKQRALELRNGKPPKK